MVAWSAGYPAQCGARREEPTRTKSCASLLGVLGVFVVEKKNPHPTHSPRVHGDRNSVPTALGFVLVRFAAVALEAPRRLAALAQPRRGSAPALRGPLAAELADDRQLHLP